MEGKCKSVGLILAILIIVFALWETTYSKWILVAIGILFLLHAIGCKCSSCNTEALAAKPKKKKK